MDSRKIQINEKIKKLLRKSVEILVLSDIRLLKAFLDFYPISEPKVASAQAQAQPPTCKNATL